MLKYFNQTGIFSERIKASIEVVMDVKNIAPQDNQLLQQLEKSQGPMLRLYSGAVHVENKLTLTQHKAWIYLLYNALQHPDPINQDTFSISISELRSEINYKSSNLRKLYETLSDLIGVKIKWNIFNKDDEWDGWGVAGMLSYFAVKPNSRVAEYSFHRELRQRLFKPPMYLRAHMMMINQFEKKHALPLYLLALDYLDHKQNKGIRKLSVEQMRQYLGIEDGKYKRPKDFHRCIIKDSVNYINSTMDMKLSIEPIRGGNNIITHYMMEMEIKPEFVSFYNKAYQLLSNGSSSDVKEVLPQKLPEFKEKVLKSFLSDNKISLSSMPVRVKLIELEEKLGQEALEQYLISISKRVLEVDKAGRVKKGIPQLFITLLKSDDQLANFTHSLQQQAEPVDQVEDEHLEKELDKLFKQRQVEELGDFIKVSYDQVSDKISDLLQGNHLLKDKVGSKDNIISSKPILSVLLKNSNQLGFVPKTSYESFKNGLPKEEIEIIKSRVQHERKLYQN